MITRRLALIGAGSAMGAASLPAHAQTTKPIRIGILEDMSGVFSDLGGPSSVVAARMAVQDVGGSVAGRPIEIISGDHQNKPDIGLSIARQWFDTDGVGLVTGLTNSAVALGVQKLAADKDRISIVQNAATDALIGQDCSPNGIVWNWVAGTIVRLTVEAALRTSGRSWYMITSDYAGGHVMEDQAEPVIKAAGGVIKGSASPPLGASDFSSFLLTAQSSGAQVLGVVTFGHDFTNLFKQAVDFGIPKTMQLVAPFVFQSDLAAVGVAAIKGMPVAAPFYWDLNPETRAFTERFRTLTGRPPDVGHAGTYNALMHYFRSIQAAGSADTAQALAAMRARPVNDMSTKDGTIRRDGMVVRPIYMFVGKDPKVSKERWDLLRYVETVPKGTAFPDPMASECRLLRS